MQHAAWSISRVMLRVTSLHFLISKQGPCDELYLRIFIQTNRRPLIELAHVGLVGLGILD